MSVSHHSYPVRAVSRAGKRTAKLRLAWFVVGTSFGIGTAFFMVPGAHVVAPIAAPVPQQQAAIIPTPPPPAPVAAIAIPPSKEVALVDDHGLAIEKDPASMAALAVANSELAPASNNAASRYPLTLDLKVENGDTMITLLTDAGVSHDEAFSVVQAMGKTFNPKKLDIGQSVSVVLDKAPGAEHATISRMSMPVSAVASLEITRGKNNSFNVKKVNAPTERKLAHVGGRIDSSLYSTGSDIGIPASLLAEIITAYSYDVDFQRDIHEGDAVDVLYERMETTSGAVAGYGNIIFAELELSGDKMKIYRYVDKGGNSDYYNAKGESVRKALLRTPINGARITSSYGMRNHPLLGYSRMHRGVDFGAPTGTPIYAAGDGTVEVAASKSGYGNYLRIRHSNSYATAYAHISRFVSGMMAGKKVKQGQVVAYVGATGMATGPHLHYEVLVNNAQVNPANVKFKTGTVLKGTELASFRKTIQKIETQLASMPRGGKALAMANIQGDLAN